MPPGYLQVAGDYYLIESGWCGGHFGTSYRQFVIETAAECLTAAAALGLPSPIGSHFWDYSATAERTFPSGCLLGTTSWAPNGAVYVYKYQYGNVCGTAGKSCICKGLLSGRRLAEDEHATPQRRLLSGAYSRFPGDVRDSRPLPNVQQLLVYDFDQDGKKDLFLHAPALSSGSCAQRCHSLGRFGERQPHLYTLPDP